MYFRLCRTLAWSCCSCLVNMGCQFQSSCFCLGLQVMKKAHVARQKLLRLGIFKDVEVLIDTSEGNASEMWPHGVFVLLNMMAVCLAGVSMQKLSFFHAVWLSLLRHRRFAQRSGCNIWGDRGKEADGKLQHHGWQQWRKHGERNVYILFMPTPLSFILQAWTGAWLHLLDPIHTRHTLVY